jgi:hypothetical protein
VDNRSGIHYITADADTRNVRTDRLVTPVIYFSEVFFGDYRLVLARCAAEQPARHPQRRYEHMHGIRQKSRLVAFDQMSEPGQRKRCRDQQQGDDPVKPNDDEL